MEVNGLSEEVKTEDHECVTCGLEITREKDYFEDRDILCYCCENETHHVLLGDIRLRDMMETDDGFYIEDQPCRYCDKKLSLEFTFRDNAVLMREEEATWETDRSVQISFGDAD
tara:strand:+ start:67 stop:408 length:342 start_codon:yes stop_codon:yes gene_type:complete